VTEPTESRPHGPWVERTGPDDTRTFRERHPWIPENETGHFWSETAARQLFESLKVHSLERLQAWARTQPHDAIDMHTGNFPEAVAGAWDEARESELALSPGQLRLLAPLEVVFTYVVPDQGAALQGVTSVEDCVEEVVAEICEENALDWLREYTRPAPMREVDL
jgi:hypothetical protein